MSMEIEEMNLADCEFKHICYGMQGMPQEMGEIVDKVVSLEGNLKPAHCRIASFINRKLEKLYYLALWDGSVSHDPDDVVHYGDKSQGSLYLLGMSNVEIQMGSMDDRIPCCKGDVLDFDFTGPGYFLYIGPLLKHGIKLPWQNPQVPQPPALEKPSNKATLPAL